MREALKALLMDAARSGRALTYAEAAKSLQLPRPQTIHKAALLIEDLMGRQAASNEPQLASLVVSKALAGLPEPGFFVLTRDLGMYDGVDEGADARAFVEAERKRCRSMY